MFDQIAHNLSQPLKCTGVLASVPQLQEPSPDPSAVSHHDSDMEHSSCVQEAVGSDGLVTLSSAVGDTSSDIGDTGSTQEVQYSSTTVHVYLQ